VSSADAGDAHAGSPADTGGAARSAGRLAGKTALITGAANGIGAAIARRFAAEGADLLLTDIDPDAVAALAQELAATARGHELDVRSESAWEAVLGWASERHGRVDVLVNNAGVFLAAPLTDTTLEQFRRIQDVNQVGVFLGMKTLAPAMAARGGGSIINVSSIAGLVGPPLLVAYAASKWAVRGMTKTAAKELAASGVRVNSLHPGQIETDMHARQREATPELIERLVAGIPMKRVGEPREVAEVAVFLASDESSYVTGAEFSVDGGARP
jgi:3alpha(or 20beta)-hydroxysteroid dehydrogenase